MLAQFPGQMEAAEGQEKKMLLSVQ